jgi:AP-3 complex subunit mu
MPCVVFTHIQLLEETLDSIGHPLTTSPNALRDIVLPPTLLSKVLSAAGASGLPASLSGAASTPNPFASAIPWRRAHVKYAQNEIYFDVAEELRAIVNKSGTPLSTHVQGRIETNSRLSGTPDVTLSFVGVQNLTDVAFHPCVRIPRWTRDKSLSFVPPDGKFILVDYRFAPGAALGGGSSSAPSAGASLTAANQVPVPIALKPTLKLHETGGTFELTVNGRTGGKPLTNVSVELFLGANATGVSCQTSGSGDGNWTFDSERKILKWEMASLGTGTGTLKGTFNTT